MKQIVDIKKRLEVNNIKSITSMVMRTLFILFFISVFTSCKNNEPTVSFTLTDTGQDIFYDNEGNVINRPEEGEAFYGEDAQYTSTKMKYRDNADGTVTDMNTGLMWQKTPSATMSYEKTLNYVANLKIGGYVDWRLPTIKELYSLADFNGELVRNGVSTPYINTEYFDSIRNISI